MQINIKQASIVGSLFLKYKFERIELAVKDTINTSSDAPIHDDLRNAFRRLIPHFAFICEEVRDSKLVAKAVKDPELYLSDRETAPDETFFKYRVFGFNLIEKKGVNLLELTGSKQLENMEEISFSTYAVDVNDNEYEFRIDLNDAINNLKEEVLAYMQGKYAPKAQQEMFGEEEEEEDL